MRTGRIGQKDGLLPELPQNRLPGRLRGGLTVQPRWLYNPTMRGFSVFPSLRNGWWDTIGGGGVRTPTGTWGEINYTRGLQGLPGALG